MKLKKLQKELRKCASKEKAKILQGFFKTGPGEYGEGDIFLGVQVPHIRNIVKRYIYLSLSEVRILLRSKIHEERLAALLIIILQFNRSSYAAKKIIYGFYLKNTAYINNWDLVDLSAPHIVGAYLIDKDKSTLYQLAKSKALWQRRIAIVSTFNFIRNNQFADTLRIAKILLTDKEDLLHKATGWMLREVGKRDTGILENFLSKHHRDMPRTMLRYAIERLPVSKRRAYLKGRV